MITCRPPKKHGLGVTIDGIFKPGKTALLIDDLITQGTSKVEPLERLRSAGLVVRDVTVLIDREQGGRITLADVGATLHCALKITDIFAYYHQHNRISDDTYQKVIDYLTAEAEAAE